MKHAAAIGLAVLLPLSIAHADQDKQNYEEIARGRYLTAVGDCMPCHTAMGGAPFAGGRVVETPFGNILSSNITPDRDTGIGAWTDGQFLDALWKGIGQSGRHLYPAMPYPYYTRISRQDAMAIRAYLNTLPAVHNRVQSNQLPFPFDIRAVMGPWNWLFFGQGRFKPVAGKSAEWNRGAYLVEGLGHCAACHTGKNMLGGDSNATLQGGVLQGWFAPNINGDLRTGLGSWSADQIVTYLKTGHNDIGTASGPMAEVIKYSTSQMTDADLKAMAVYLKDQPAAKAQAPQPVPAGEPSMRAGQAIYVDNCSACHGSDGAGVARMFPALRHSPSVQSREPTSLIRVVLQGAQSVATEKAPTGPSMPAFGWKLSDQQVADVLTYIRNSWGNVAGTVSSGDVHGARQSLAQRAD